MYSGARTLAPFIIAAVSAIRQLVQQHVRFAIQHTIALLNGGLPDGLREMTLAGAAGAEEQRIFALADESARSQIEDHAAIHLRVEAYSFPRCPEERGSPFVPRRQQSGNKAAMKNPVRKISAEAGGAS
jgi:hypothetical protein